jgi:hypothetical protein
VVENREKGDAVSVVITSNPVLTAIAFGIAIGLVLVIMIAIARANQKVNSLVDEQEYVNAIVTVRIPFGQETLGRVWLERSGQRIMMTAKTRDDHEFLRGDQAVIIEVKDGTVWVSPTGQAWSV